MYSAAHAAVGAAIQKSAGKKWKWLFPILIPIMILSHGFLDASNIYHEFDAVLIITDMAGLALLAIFCRKYWIGILFALLPDIDWVLRMAGVPFDPMSPWSMHYYLVQAEPWLLTQFKFNWHGLYGAHWGLWTEVALTFGLLIYLTIDRCKRKEANCRKK